MSSSHFDKNHPFLASIKERYSLSKTGSKKNTIHLVLDLGDSGIVYEVGDSVGIYPRYDVKLADKTLHALGVSGDELIITKQNEEISLRHFLMSRGNLSEVTPRLFRLIAEKHPSHEKQDELKQLLSEENREQYKAYVEQFEVWDFLLAHSEVKLNAQAFIDSLMPLLPRFYSISSSQKVVGNEIHLTIAPLEFISNGHVRYGVCTHYLMNLVKLNDPVVPIFIQPAHSFRLPLDPHAQPLIMIGPGTGIAPFRAFMQERLLHHQSKARHWLFFGEWNQEYDFLYEQEWIEFEKHGHIQLDVAFSRDQEEKIYVQHRMWEKGQEIYRWLEEGAILYICGDAKRMAKDVENELLRIIQVYGEKDKKESLDYIKELRKNKRYLRDVY